MKDSLVICINECVDTHLHFSSALYFCRLPLERAHFHRDHAQVPTSDHKLHPFPHLPGLQIRHVGSTNVLYLGYRKKVLRPPGSLISTESHLENTGRSQSSFLYLSSMVANSEPPCSCRPYLNSLPS